MTREQWTVPQAAAYLNVSQSTVRAYLARQQMPKPDGRVGRTAWWWADTIRQWRPAAG